jgi:hypothetical protein
MRRRQVPLRSPSTEQRGRPHYVAPWYPEVPEALVYSSPDIEMVTFSGDSGETGAWSACSLPLPGQNLHGRWKGVNSQN